MHSIIGRNSRLDSIQASVLNVKLPHLDSWNTRRREAAGYYKSKLGGIKSLILPLEPENRIHVYHLFVIRSKKRDDLMEHLKRNGIASSVHYPAPLPFLDAYSYKHHAEKDFPVTLSVSKEILSIPLFPSITHSQVDYICETILDFMQTDL
jgi:dTDP-4-amino-4,6-dideoxygalactose transaminase